MSCQRNVPESHIINPLLTKPVSSRRLDTGLVRLFCASMDLNIQPSWPHTWSIWNVSKPFWLRCQSETDAWYSNLQKNEIMDLSAILTKVCRWLFIAKSAFALGSRLKFTPVRDKQRKNGQYFNDISLQKVLFCFSAFFPMFDAKNISFPCWLFIVHNFWRTQVKLSEASVLKISFNSDRTKKNRGQLLLFKVSTEKVEQISCLLYVSGKRY